MATEPSKSKRKRRWLRYSLRTFVVVLTVFCVLMAWLGALVYRVNKQKEAVQWVRDEGGTVYYDYPITFPLYNSPPALTPMRNVLPGRFA